MTTIIPEYSHNNYRLIGTGSISGTLSIQQVLALILRVSFIAVLISMSCQTSLYVANTVIKLVCFENYHVILILLAHQTHELY